MAYMLTQACLAKVVTIAAGRTCSVLCAFLAQLETNITFCQQKFDYPAYSHISQQYSYHLYQASSSVAAFLATDQTNVTVSGNYLKTCFLPKRFVLASPLLAWLLIFVGRG